MNERDRKLIDEQIDYYRKRAPEYDATSTPEGDPLASQALVIETAFDAFHPGGRILELACGTGSWTRQLVAYGDHVTALDASPEMLALARAKVGDTRVRYIEADVFGWTPDVVYDVVFFANWLSHVPPSRFDDFWALVARCVEDRGRVFFIDEAEDAWRHEEELTEEFLEGGGTPLVRRRLQDGSAHRVVKVFWNPQELQARLRSMGWDVRVQSTGAFFWGEGSRSLPPSAT